MSAKRPFTLSPRTLNQRPDLHLLVPGGETGRKSNAGELLVDHTHRTIF